MYTTSRCGGCKRGECWWEEGGEFERASGGGLQRDGGGRAGAERGPEGRWGVRTGWEWLGGSIHVQCVCGGSVVGRVWWERGGGRS